jgi:hypothetical protein
MLVSMSKTASEWPKLAALKNVHVLKFEQGKSNEFAFLVYMISGYGYIGLCMVSASVHVSCTGAIKM